MATLTLADVRRLLEEINHQVWLDDAIYQVGKDTHLKRRLGICGLHADKALAALDEVVKRVESGVSDLGPPSECALRRIGCDYYPCGVIGEQDYGNTR